MSRFKKIVSVILAAAVVFSICTAYPAAATAKVSGIKILSLPVKTELYRGEDWIYGLWNTDNVTNAIKLVESSQISFTHNPCGGIYPERGMLDMSGLVIEVSYSDGTTKQMAYKETTNSSGRISANILVSPKGGKEYFVGTNTMEVYLSSAPKYYDSFDVEFIDNQTQKDITSDTAVIDYEYLYIYGLETNLTADRLLNYYIDANGAEITLKKTNRSYKYYGTGSTVTVTQADGSSRVYTIIIFGDADGNGIINMNDISFTGKAVLDSSELSDAQIKAVNLDGIRRITQNDVSYVSRIAADNELDQKLFC